MPDESKPESTIDDVRELCVDFGIPFVLLIILAALLVTGIDGEVKTLFAAVVGWLTNSGVRRTRKGK